MSKSEKVYWKLPPEYKAAVAVAARREGISQSRYIARIIKQDQPDEIAATLPDMMEPGRPKGTPQA